MTRTQKFHSDLKFAKKGEGVAMDIFIANDFVVEDVSNNPAYFSKGIDFIAHKEQRRVTVEVKFDGWINTTSNMCFELYSSNGKEGWFYTTQAEILAIVCQHTHTTYMVKMEDVRKYVAQFGFMRKVKHNDCGVIFTNGLIGMEHYKLHFPMNIYSHQTIDKK